MTEEWSNDEVGVGVSCDAGDPWPWRIEVDAAEFVREEPFESEFRRRIDAAIRSVGGITDVTEEDREVWLAAGQSDGEAIVAAVATALDAMAEQIEAALEGD
jgi:hypothetical protein